MTVHARAPRLPSLFFATVRQTVRDLNRDLAIVDMRTMDDLLGDMAHQQQIPATVLTLVAALGLLLSAHVGLYGVVAYGVRERAREPRDSPRSGRATRGRQAPRLAAGLHHCRHRPRHRGWRDRAIAQVLRNRLFGAGVVDPTLLLAVGAVLLAASFAAVYLPARWGSALEPAQTLRSE